MPIFPILMQDPYLFICLLYNMGNILWRKKRDSNHIQQMPSLGVSQFWCRVPIGPIKFWLQTHSVFLHLISIVVFQPASQLAQRHKLLIDTQGRTLELKWLQCNTTKAKVWANAFWQQTRLFAITVCESRCTPGQIVKRNKAFECCWSPRWHLLLLL